MEVVESAPDPDQLARKAAEVIIAHANRILIPPRTLEQLQSTHFPVPEQILRQQDVEMILKSSEKCCYLDPLFFSYFIEGTRYPTSYLPIKHHAVSDRTLFLLLLGQAYNLLELNLEGNAVRVVVIVVT